MGFCIFNNIAVATAHALEVRGLERVAIVDYGKQMDTAPFSAVI